MAPYSPVVLNRRTVRAAMGIESGYHSRSGLLTEGKGIPPKPCALLSDRVSGRRREFLTDSYLRWPFCCDERTPGFLVSIWFATTKLNERYSNKNEINRLYHSLFVKCCHLLPFFILKCPASVPWDNKKTPCLLDF